jgi:hypothetical protein
VGLSLPAERQQRRSGLEMNEFIYNYYSLTHRMGAYIAFSRVADNVSGLPDVRPA